MVAFESHCVGPECPNRSLNSHGEGVREKASTIKGIKDDFTVNVDCKPLPKSIFYKFRRILLK